MIKELKVSVSPIQLKESLKRAHPFCLSLDFLLAVSFLEGHFLPSFCMYIKSFDGMRKLAHFKAEKTPHCLNCSYIARVDVVLHFIMVGYLLFSLGDCNLSTVVSFVNVLKQIFDSVERGTDLYIDVSVKHLQ